MKGSKGKQPAYQFYPMDWDRDLSPHPLYIEGAWIRICNHLWFSPDRGISSKTISQWARLLRIRSRQAHRILKYIDLENIGDVIWPEVAEQNKKCDSHCYVTVMSRRMVNDQKQRKQWASRKQKQREKEGVTDESQECPPLSSTSSSISIIIPLKNNSDYLVSKTDINEWINMYKNIDVILNLKEIREWNISNPKKRKTKSGIRKHITSWLSKSNKEPVKKTDRQAPSQSHILTPEEIEALMTEDE